MSSVSRARSGERAGRGLTWAAYSAAACALLFAAVSLYWALGGTTGLRTVGAEAERLGRARDTQVMVAVWAATVLKVVGAVLALALVRPWGRTVPRRVLLVASWGAAAVLTLYGGVLVTMAALVETGIFDVSEPVDWTAMRWHLALWDPWFVVWGVILGLAARQYTRMPTAEDRSVGDGAGG